MARNLNRFLAEIGRAKAMDDGGNTDGAIAIYSQLLKEHPIAGIYFQRGSSHLDRGDFDNAILDLSKAIEFDPSDADAYLNRGNAYYEKEHYDVAIADHKTAIEILMPPLARALNSRGAAYRKIGDFDGAIRDLTLAGQLETTWASPHLNLAKLYIARGRPADALPHVKRAGELDPDDPTVHRLRLQLNAALERLHEENEG